MAGFGKIAASRLWLRAWLVLPDAAKLDQALFAHNTELHSVERTLWFVSMILNSKALELQGKPIIGQLNHADGKAKNRHAAVFFQPVDKKRAIVGAIR